MGVEVDVTGVADDEDAAGVAEDAVVGWGTVGGAAGVAVGLGIAVDGIAVEDSAGVAEDAVVGGETVEDAAVGLGIAVDGIAVEDAAGVAAAGIAVDG